MGSPVSRRAPLRIEQIECAEDIAERVTPVVTRAESEQRPRRGEGFDGDGAVDSVDHAECLWATPGVAVSASAMPCAKVSSATCLAVSTLVAPVSIDNCAAAPSQASGLVGRRPRGVSCALQDRDHLSAVATAGEGRAQSAQCRVLPHQMSGPAVSGRFSAITPRPLRLGPRKMSSNWRGWARGRALPGRQPGLGGLLPAAQGVPRPPPLAVSRWARVCEPVSPRRGIRHRPPWTAGWRERGAGRRGEPADGSRYRALRHDAARRHR